MSVRGGRSSGRPPRTMQFCQWAGCNFVAVRFVRRGERMANLCLCTGHAARFHLLSDRDAAIVSADRQPRRHMHAPPSKRVAA